MTRQHFERFVEEIKFSQQDDATRRAAAEMVANVAKTFNGRFDVDRFYRAAGVDTVKGGK